MADSVTVDILSIMKESNLKLSISIIEIIGKFGQY